MDQKLHSSFIILSKYSSIMGKIAIRTTVVKDIYNFAQAKIINNCPLNASLLKARAIYALNPKDLQIL